MSQHTALTDKGERVAVLIYANDTPLPFYADDEGIVYVVGNAGGTYSLRIINTCSERIETIVAMDGKDVIQNLRSTSATRGMVIPTKMTWKCLGRGATKEVCRRFVFPSADADMDHMRITFYKEGPGTLVLPQNSTYVLPEAKGMSTGKRCGSTKFARHEKFTLTLRVANAGHMIGMAVAQL